MSMAASEGRKTRSRRKPFNGKRFVCAAMLAALVCPGGAQAQQTMPSAQRPASRLSATSLQTTGSIIMPAAGPAKTPPGLPATDLSEQTTQRIRGLVVARRQANISAAIAATITFIGPDNGGRFRKGDTLVKFDCDIYDAELNRANAVAEAASDSETVKRKLAQSGSISRLQAILAGAELKKARADVLVAKARAAHCLVPAPFSGRVVRRIANAYETVAPRDPLIEIVDDRDVEIRVFVPSNWLRWLRPGEKFSFKVDETGATVAACIVALGASIDNVSQLIELRATLDRTGPATTGGPGLLPGMSGNAYFRETDVTSAQAMADNRSRHIANPPSQAK